MIPPLSPSELPRRSSNQLLNTPHPLSKARFRLARRPWASGLAGTFMSPRAAFQAAISPGNYRVKTHAIAMTLRAAGRFGALTRPAPCVGRCVSGRPSLAVRTRGPPPEPDQREMPERWHRAAFEHVHSAVLLGPPCQPSPAEFRAPAEAARHRRKALLEQAAWPGLGAEMVDQDDLAAGLGDARELVQRRLRIGHGGDDVLRHHHVKEAIGKAEVLRVHHRQCIDMTKLMRGDALMRLAQHRLGV